MTEPGDGCSLGESNLAMLADDPLEVGRCFSSMMSPLDDLDPHFHTGAALVSRGDVRGQRGNSISMKFG
jgi:hypothetical protein